MISVENIHKSFGTLEVLKGVSLDIPAGQVVSIVGASGAGKTTLLEIMGTLSSPDSGKVVVAGQDISQANKRELALLRNRSLGFVFQFHHLLPEFSALENVMIPALIAHTDKATAEQRAKELLQYLKLSHRLHHKPMQLSGGEQQRVAMARALVNKPAVILADEPSGNLDSHNKEELHRLFFQLRDEIGQTSVIVTHEESLANMCDRKVVMSDGMIVSQ